MKRKWMFTIINCLSIIAGIVSCGIIFVYWYTFGSISNDKEYWAAFGSVISGAFTLMSSSATIATLLFLYKQQDENDTHQKEQQNKHDTVIEKQMAALTFEQYLNHRKIFFDRLQEQASLFKNNITFKNPERVYSTIFYGNSPTHCSYKIDIIKDENNSPANIKDCIDIFNSIEKILDNYDDKENNLKLIEKIFRLQSCLGYEYRGETRSGDVYYLDNRTGINIYEINASIYILESVLNSILFYTGNKPVQSIKHKAQGYLLRDELYDNINNSYRAKDSYYVIFKSDGIRKIFEIYLMLRNGFELNLNIMEDSFRELELIFIDKNKVCELENINNERKIHSSLWGNYIKSGKYNEYSSEEFKNLSRKISLALTTFFYSGIEK